MSKTQELLSFFDDQLACWPQVSMRYRDLTQVCTRDITIDGFPVRLQHNPARAISAAAAVDKAAIAARPCFLCERNRPSCQLVYEGFPEFDTLVNPFPIFPHHFTIASKQHIPQDNVNLSVMGNIARCLPGFVVFFNGSSAGASAPDHLHFQAGDVDFLPVCSIVEADPGVIMKATGDFTLYSPEQLPAAALHFVSRGVDAEMLRWADTLLPDNRQTLLPDIGMRNLLMWVGKEGLLHTLMYPRCKHRPDCYHLSPQEGGMLVSPGAVDMAGVIILPRKSDFETMASKDIRNIYDEVSFPFKESARLASLLLL